MPWQCAHHLATPYLTSAEGEADAGGPVRGQEGAPARARAVLSKKGDASFEGARWEVHAWRDLF